MAQVTSVLVSVMVWAATVAALGLMGLLWRSPTRASLARKVLAASIPWAAGLAAWLVSLVVTAVIHRLGVGLLAVWVSFAAIYASVGVLLFWSRPLTAIDWAVAVLGLALSVLEAERVAAQPLGIGLSSVGALGFIFGFVLVVEPAANDVLTRLKGAD